VTTQVIFEGAPPVTIDLNIVDMIMDYKLFIGENTLRDRGIDVARLFVESLNKEEEIEEGNQEIEDDVMIRGMFEQKPIIPGKETFSMIPESEEKDKFIKFITEELGGILWKRDPTASAKVTEVDIVLKQGATIARCSPRQYTPVQLEYIKTWLQELKDLNFIAASTSPWSSPVHVVSDDAGKMRLVVDYREINKRIEYRGCHQENLDYMGLKLRSTRFYFRLDLSKAFWQIPITETASQFFTFHSPIGTFRPLRLPQGYINSVSELNVRLAEILSEERNIIIYVDDILGFSDSILDLLVILRSVIEKLSRANLLLNLEKSVLLADDIIFCGRRIWDGAVSFAPTALEILKNQFS
jgi:hypothetical protein